MENNGIMDLLNAINNGGQGLSAAVDIRRNSVVCYLCSNSDGDVLAVNSASYEPEGKDNIHKYTIDIINEIITGICTDYCFEGEDITAFVFSGGTRELSAVDGDETSLFGIEERAMELGLFGRRTASAFISPCVSADVGGNIPAGLLYCDTDLSDETILYIDFGASTVSVLKKNNKYYALATDTPVFAGMGFSGGICSESGAIYEGEVGVLGEIRYHTIHNVVARGVCGAGIVDITALNLEKGFLTSDGKITDGEEIHLVDGLTLKENDFFLLKKNKSAVLDSISSITDAAEVSTDDIDKVYITGSYGAQFKYESLKRIGALPCFSEKTEVVVIGNASGMGAVKALKSVAERDRMMDISEKFKLAEKFTSDNIYFFNCRFTI